MKICLFQHNQIAYIAALSMLAEVGKAAIIHPTGTGKSFIAFKLCEEHPDAKVCWLSPSEYIYKTQQENLIATGADVPQNICFYTYAKLMSMGEDEIREIDPDFIILDEFHRCGAEMWGAGVDKLLCAYPTSPLLGLTATNIRYLDGQRDMADELFDGNIASEITLGDAIVRGILNPPKYVLSVFSYQKDLERYERRVRTAKSFAVRDAGEKYLEALRRALTNAEGIEKIFQKHMTDRHGKYIVFCSNAEHMREMMQNVPDWFGAIDTAPHVYSAYSDDPETSRAFSDFKADNSDHLKLLFCIDMLNEGVHVENVSGVILLRPTVSPIIYKQQIGRALSASKTKDAVIFDIVMNVNNLYSIDSIREEMQAAITYYRYLGQYENVVNSTFDVIDEVQDCKRLFDRLEETLNASWDLMYAEAKQYYRQHGDLMLPARYRTENGLPLGAWLGVQRKIHNGNQIGHLTERQIELLEQIGIVWENYHLQIWEQNYQEAKHYFEQNGDLKVPSKYISESGFALGMWIQMVRAARVNQRTSIVTPERIERLNEIGMVWAVISDQWEKNYQEAVRYYQEHGNLLIPSSYISENGLKLGNWIGHLRMAKRGKGRGKLTDEQIARLDLIGMAWDADEERWQIGVTASKKYAAVHHHLCVPMNYMTDDGFNLGLWIQLKRRQYKKGRLTREQVCELESLGMRWDVHGERWQEMYRCAEAYYLANGDLNVPRGYLAENGSDLGAWISRCRSDKKLTAEQIGLLEDIGMQWPASKKSIEIYPKAELRVSAGT